ncbi:MAG: hypothetical protein K2J71_03075 [Oscillospiraceae bacterium]|nr:hypothetical protein [Oscillospiraceae bacterium]
MKNFSEKSLSKLGESYVYGLIDPRNNQIFYIGMGTGNRVFDHEQESLKNPDSEKLKLKTIAEIKAAGFAVKKVIINWNLKKSEAFAAEASLINIFNYIGSTRLTNIVAGHHSPEAFSVEEFEKLFGAEELQKSDIQHKIMIIKINQLYHRGMPDDVLYDIVRGCWKINPKRAKAVEYVLAFYNSLIVAVYKPTAWYLCKDAPDRMPERDRSILSEIAERSYFIDENYEQHAPLDEAQKFYLGKFIVNSSQNPVSYINC